MYLLPAPMAWWKKLWNRPFDAVKMGISETFSTDFVRVLDKAWNNLSIMAGTSQYSNQYHSQASQVKYSRKVYA